MEFYYEDCFYVSEDDLDEMVNICKNLNVTPQEALNRKSAEWEDEFFYAVGHVEDEIIAEIEKRLLTNN